MLSFMSVVFLCSLIWGWFDFLRDPPQDFHQTKFIPQFSEKIFESKSKRRFAKVIFRSTNNKKSAKSTFSRLVFIYVCMTFHRLTSVFTKKVLVLPIVSQQARYSMTKGTETATAATTSTKKLKMTITKELLQKQNAETSNALIEYWKDSATFGSLAKYEGDLTIQRDQEDAVKLEKGIEFAKEKGVIDPDFVPEPYVKLDVLGKTPDTVATEIIEKTKSNDESKSSSEGSVIVLCGLSGTGKGTTVSKLRQKLEEQEGKNVVTWSNGNIFRSVTLLAVTWCEQQSDIDGFDKDRALTKENLQSFIGMLSFGKFKNDKYDTRINGLGLDMLISEVQNTELKSPKVSKNIPTVAEVTQGEVILFAANAVETMGKDGLFVLLEGREQTVNYVRTPYRFTLILSDESLIGKRRAAQRLMAKALDKVSDSATDDEVIKALDESLQELAKDVQ